MRLSLIATAVLCASSLCASSVVCHADTFTFTVSSNGTSGSGTLTGAVDPFNASAFDITSGTGMFGGQSLALYTPSGNTQTTRSTGGTAPYTYDNVLFISGSGSFLDGNGLLFTIGGTQNVLNIYSGVGGYFLSQGSTNVFNPVTTATFSVNVAATPEPSSLALLGTGLLGMVGMVRKRFA